MGENARPFSDSQGTAEGPPFIVGLGASAGGIAALKEFFEHVPPESGAAYVVILHLSPDHDSQLAEVLQATAQIPVTQVTERSPIQANHVYVVPPNKYLSIERDSIAVSEMTRAEHRRAPVDLFFRSLADARGSKAVCVVLSGTGPNGSSGLKRVKEYGGLAIAQDPEEAQHGDMPRNSIATGLVDCVVPVAEMPERIRQFHERIRDDGDTVRAEAADPEVLREILSVLRIRAGHDFSNYKPATIQRRVMRRVHLLNLGSIHDYARTVRENPGECVALMKDLLISVTNFFRDAAVFETLDTRVLPRLFLTKRSSEQLRVWVPGCATGEEAYSIAMLLTEHAAATADPPAIQVFASDLDESAIAVAREAFYTDADIADVPEQRLHQFFVRQGGGFRVRRDLREMVLFAHHNVIKDPPFSHIDLISCRNVLIYLNRGIQERIIETFHFALKPGGYLMLGPSESPEHPSDLFAVVDKTARIFESRLATSRLVLPPLDLAAVVPRMLPKTLPPQGERIAPAELHQRLLEQYAPPSLVVTDDHYVVHMSESVGRFMQVPGGEPSRDLLRMVRPELRADLRTALHQASRERTAVDVADLPVALEEGERRVDITVRPVLREEPGVRGYLLVTFAARESGPAAEAARRPIAKRDESLAAQLDDEIARLKQQLRTTVEQYETQAEEAKAANEELQAMNEELRSSAEELETSREELQSVNEELTTVNQELKIKIEELWLSNNDFQNLMNSSDIGTIFLDRHLRVKMATPTAGQVFNLLGSDTGRPLSDITSSLLYDNLFDDARRVLDDLRTIDAEVQTRDGRWILTRLRPYRTTDNRIDGVVVTLQDITERRQAQERLRQGEERLRLLIDGAIDYAIFTMTSDGVIDSWNSGAERMFGYSVAEITGQHTEILFTAEDRSAGVPKRELQTAIKQGRASDERFHVRRDGTRFYCSGVTIRLGESFGLAKIARDLSTQQQAADALRLVEAEFENRLRERTDSLAAEVDARAAAHSHVSSLLRRIVTAQEDERARIARDLHDQLGQQLTALRLTLERRRQLLEPGEAGHEEIATALSIADRLDNDLDFLAWELRPAVLDDLGLAAALPLFVREWSEHYGISAEYRAESFAAGQLGPDAEIVFYRVAQEALNNVVKHAHASRVDVLLEKGDGSVVLVVEDNGVGFDLDKEVRDKGLGIIGMQERASLIGASLDIESRIGQGTSVFVRAPLARIAEGVS